MKDINIKLKNVDMLCNKCVMHVLKVLTKLEEVKELEVDLNKRLIRIVLNDKRITKQMIIEMVNNAIAGRRTQELLTIV